MLVRTKVLTTAAALLTGLFVTLPAAQGQASAEETQNSETVKIATKYIGIPYCRGGESTRCFDCSGFIQYVFDKNGIEIPRTANEQLAVMTVISKDEAQVGDLVFFVYSNGYAHHVGIYVGNNTILHSPKPGRRVKLEEIWSTRIVFARNPSMVFLIPPPVEANVEEATTKDEIIY